MPGKNRVISNQFGETIKQLRELNCLLQREVASSLEIDTPMLSKIERGVRKAKKGQVLLLAKLFNTESDRLIALWLADQVLAVIKNESNAKVALAVAEKAIK